ncbi:MAG: hypothetical protein ACRCVT_08180 [Leadbetterella sp.]
MKKILEIALLTLLVSCNSNSTKEERAKHAQFSKFKITDNLDILGTWTMCSYSHKNLIITANECRQIKINHNGTGSVSISGIDSEFFVWKLKNDSLSISNTDKKTTNTFSNTTFITRFEKSKDEYLLTIIDNTLDYKYYLSQ